MERTRNARKDPLASSVKRCVLDNPGRVRVSSPLYRQHDRIGAVQPPPTADRYVVTVGALLCLERFARSPVAGGSYQLLSVRHGAFRVMAAGDRRATLCTAAVIPPGARYAVEGCSLPMARLFVDAESATGRRLRDELATTAGSGPAPWIAVGERLVEPSFWNILDPATFAAAIQRMLANLDRAPPHLGLPRRALTRWSRLERYTRLRCDGAPIAAAARDAGFPTARRFFHTIERHFGLGESDLADPYRWTAAETR
jgi:hypothetical protein